ncbi:energy transducer TonB [Salibacter halophilus]|uniref:TonB C-terminal domain-containing protein n=1 Tax=Salibacter halophilus TaxID=1803916 RepID=A0A6N6M707_9FLAO|nr:energy transducer TonB [Salibacter halophilus]KAB1065588.1 hypothetical protein F3059_02740 [Salibacter halophilus]
MFHKHLTLLTFLAIGVSVFGQGTKQMRTNYMKISNGAIEEHLEDYTFRDGDTLKFYFNSDWELIDNPNTATYYRKAWMKSSESDMYEVRDYYKNGTVQMKAKSPKPYPFNDYGIYHGEVVRFHENGDTASYEEYDMARHTMSTWGTHENGNLSHKGQFDRAGFRTGSWEFYYENGNLEHKGSYAHYGKKEGVWKYYHEDGSLASEMTYDQGNLEDTYTAYYESGQIQRQGEYKKGDRHGEYTYYYENGNVDRILEYKKGEFHGDVKGYYETGELKYEGQYKRGNRRKERIYYHENGTVEETYDYDRKGNIKEKSNAFYSNGNVHIERSYNRDGHLTGDYKRYLKDGTLKEEKVYNNGQISGDSKLYYDNGKKHKVITYDRGIKADIKYFDREGKQVSESDFFKHPEFEGYMKGVFNSKMEIPKKYKTTARAVIHYRVNKEGKVDSTSVIVSGSDYSDTLALKIIEEMEFEPGIYNFEKASYSNEMILNTYKDGDTKVTVGEYYYSGDKNTVFYGVDREMDYKIAATASHIVETKPYFKGGNDELGPYLDENLTYPEVSKDRRNAGVVFSQFIVEPSGVISQCEILQGVDPLVDYESLSFIYEMPVWESATQYEKNIRYKMNFPIRYSVN